MLLWDIYQRVNVVNGAWSPSGVGRESLLGSVMSWKPDSLTESTLFFKQKTKAFHG